MLKIIRRVLRLSGNLSKRIWGSFICGFLESMFGLLPIAAVFLVLIELQTVNRLQDKHGGYCYRLDCRRFNPAHDFQISGFTGCKVRQALSL